MNVIYGGASSVILHNLLKLKHIRENFRREVSKHKKKHEHGCFLGREIQFHAFLASLMYRGGFMLLDAEAFILHSMYTYRFMFFI